MREFFTISVKAINNEVLEFPKTLNFECDKVTPLQPEVVRYFDAANECIHSVKVFSFEMEGQRFGTQAVTDLAGWKQWINANCKCCPPLNCDIIYDGCSIGYGNCIIVIK